MKNLLSGRMPKIYYKIRKYLEIGPHIENIKSTKIIDLRELHKIWEQEHLKKIIKLYSVDCIFDVGANAGQYARMLRNEVGFKGLIISFEPDPDLVKIIKSYSAGDSKWIVEQSAISNENSIQIFNLMNHSEFNSLNSPITGDIKIFAKQNSVQRTIKVETFTLARIYEKFSSEYNFRKPFLKMDTQGSDCEIVRNSREVLKNFIGIQSELSVKKIYNKSIDFRQAISLYESLGFSLSAFVPNNAGHFPLLVETDCIMIRSDLTNV